VKKLWAEESKLDETDRFLKKFMLTKAWIDRDELSCDDSKIEEEERVEERLDAFEARYNFRFEEPNADQVLGIVYSVPC